MRLCLYCGYSNYDKATQCRKYDAPFVSQLTTSITQKSYLIGPEKARAIRDKALSAVVRGLLVKVYWGRRGPWPVIDCPPLTQIRPWLEPRLLYGGGIGYLVGWVLRRV